MKSRLNKPNLQRGQALAEFLVVSVALLPLLLLIPLIGKYQDISNATHLASRYVAFEAITRNDTNPSGWKSEAELAADVRKRFFSNVNAAIKTNDSPGTTREDQNQFWRDPQDNPLIRDINADISISFGTAQGASHGDGFEAASDGLPFIPLSGALQLQAKGIYTANVRVAVANLPAGLRFYEPFDGINLTINRATSLALDPWTASTPQQVESKIAASPILFPVGTLEPIGGIVNAAVTVIDLPGGLSGPKLGKLDFWSDVVPEDRLRAKQ